MPLWQISALSLLSAYYTVMHNYWTSWQSRLNVFWGPWARRADGAPPPPFPSFPRNWARTPGHADLGANLWSVGKKSPGSMYAPNLKSVASSDLQMLRGSQKIEIRHVLQVTPTSGPICGQRARTAQPPCAHQI